MFKVMIRCKKLKSEKFAKILEKVSSDYSIWLHNDAVYAFFRAKSFEQLSEVRVKLSRIKGIEYRFVKIQKVKRTWL